MKTKEVKNPQKPVKICYAENYQNEDRSARLCATNKRTYASNRVAACAEKIAHPVQFITIKTFKE